MNNTLAVAPLFFLLSFMPHTKAAIFAAITNVFLYVPNKRPTLKQMNRERYLFVGSNPEWVDEIRWAGFQAFGVLSKGKLGATPWHVVAKEGAMPFALDSMRAVYWQNENPNNASQLNELIDVIRLVEPGGFFLFDEDVFTYWPLVLARTWERLEYKVGPLNIWKRKDNGKLLGQSG